MVSSLLQRFPVQWLAVCFLVLRCAYLAEGGGHIEVHFVRYTDSCSEDAGTNKCDPMFTFCLSTPQTQGPSVRNCNYASTGETNGRFHDTNDIRLEHLSSIKGLSNPWVVPVSRFEGSSVMLVIRVRDADFFSFSHDHLITWGKELWEPVWPSKQQAQWGERVMSQDGYTMTFRIRMYCDPNYYTASCDKYCTEEDSSAGQYVCDRATGNKICTPGWQGEKCTEDMDECALGFCGASKCTNLPGDYTCHCLPYFGGKNCTDPCSLQPCQNGGTCFAHRSGDLYHCKCLEGWGGQDCQRRKEPCDATITRSLVLSGEKRAVTAPTPMF